MTGAAVPSAWWMPHRQRAPLDGLGSASAHRTRTFCPVSGIESGDVNFEDERGVHPP